MNKFCNKSLLKMRDIMMKHNGQIFYRMMFDGGSRGNPGISGAGCVIYDIYDNKVVSAYQYLGDNKSANYAEFSALILGLRCALDYGLFNLYVEGDSLMIIRQMVHKNLNLNKELSELNDVAVSLENEFSVIYYEHVKRNFNKEADKMANRAMNEKNIDEILITESYE